MYVYVCMYICVYVYTCVCIYVCMYIRVYVYTYTYTHTLCLRTSKARLRRPPPLLRYFGRVLWVERVYSEMSMLVLSGTQSYKYMVSSFKSWDHKPSVCGCKKYLTEVNERAHERQ